ncbi:MAG: hypothetical protein GY710_03125 [Desulfobacteraceae bacterium]|nr:hypothetical protein [Desulfobacteraceae bacterium]
MDRKCGFNVLNSFCMILFLVVVLLWQPVHAGQSTLYIVPPQGEVVAGKETRFNLFVYNPGGKEIVSNSYGRIMVTLTTPNNIRVVEAVPVDVSADLSMKIPARGYMKREYSILLPERMVGNIKMSLDGFQSASVLFSAAPMPLDEQTTQISLGEKTDIFQPFIKNLAPYEPMYFLLGVDPGTEKSKFQISFKYKLFNAPLESQKVNNFMDGFNLAYTQTSYWDLNSDSKPFDDTSYKPEIFYLIPKIDLEIPWIRAFGVQVGFQHESNGKDDDVSRSTNFAYIEPTMAFYLTGNYFLAVSPRIWAYVGNDNATNGDLDKYRGYFNFQAKVGNPEGFVLDTNTRWAEKGPSFQADLSYPLTSFFKNKLNLYLHLQYFNGYGEQLAEYQKKEEILRLGFSLIR